MDNTITGDDIFVLIIICLIIYFGGKALLKLGTKKFKKSEKFDEADFMEALHDGRVKFVIEGDEEEKPVKDASQINYAKMNNAAMWAEAERMAAELKDAKDALKLYQKIEKLYDSTSDTNYMDNKIEVYKRAVYKMGERFTYYLPLTKAAECMDFPLPVFKKIGDVISQDDYDHIIDQYPDLAGSFASFSEDTEIEEIVTAKIDVTARNKLIEIKHIYDSDSPHDQKIAAIEKIMNSSAKVREFLELDYLEDLLEDKKTDAPTAKVVGIR